MTTGIMMAPAILQKPDRLSSKVFDKLGEINNMSSTDQRIHPRVPTCNLISFNVYDGDGRLVSHSMAKALNISQGGILIESAVMLKADYISLMSADTHNKLVEVKGLVRFSKETENGRFETGISFEGTHEENVEFAKGLVKVFHRRKNCPVVTVNQ
jgi:hypothetical protein